MLQALSASPSVLSTKSQAATAEASLMTRRAAPFVSRRKNLFCRKSLGPVPGRLAPRDIVL